MKSGFKPLRRRVGRSDVEVAAGLAGSERTSGKLDSGTPVASWTPGVWRPRVGATAQVASGCRCFASVVGRMSL